MRTGRPKVAFLTEDERRRLDSLAHRDRHRRSRAHDLGVCRGNGQQSGRPAPPRDAGDSLQMAQSLRTAGIGRSV
jgi:hypothetical protein